MKKWEDKADCHGLPVKMFYPSSGDNHRIPVAICNNCPVKRECGEYGVYNERYGVWGGMTENERTRIRNRLNIPLPPMIKIDMREYTRPGRLKVL